MTKPPARPFNVHTIRHGYNIADLDQLAHAAVRRGARSGVVPASDLYQTAWSAIAEHLYTVDEPPRSFDLIGAGMQAISDAIWAGERCHGWDRARRNIRPSFATFWLGAGTPSPSPEGRVIDRTALWQIWPELTEAQREALLALASLGDYQTAATSLGLSYKAFHWRIRSAREAFLSLWHEHEAPSRVWSADRRRWRDGRRVGGRRLVDHASIKKAHGRGAA
ncbi:hypothetical protein ACWEPC_27335 [Nonomuraea sp. NPDC004297]